MKKRFTLDYLFVKPMLTDSDTPHMKSFFISILMEKYRRPLFLHAQYRQLNSLQEIAAWTVSRTLKTSQKLDRLEKEENIPKALSSEIRNFFPSEKDENNKIK